MSCQYCNIGVGQHKTFCPEVAEYAEAAKIEWAKGFNDGLTNQRKVRPSDDIYYKRGYISGHTEQERLEKSRRTTTD